MEKQNWELTELTHATIETLKKVEFPLLMPGVNELNESRKTLLTQLETRLLPKFAAQEFPAVVVFGGSSGAGKSTLVNSLLGEQISAVSIIRPTTLTPIIVAHPADLPAIARHPIAKYGKLVESPAAIRGIVFVDAPDLDSVNEANQNSARRIIESADLWIFTTTAARYGDAYAWQLLELAHQRGLTCAVVLNRLPEKARQVVRADLQKRLITANLADTPLFEIADFSPLAGLIPRAAVAKLKEWLELLAQTKISDLIAQRTTLSLLPSLRDELLLIAEGLETQKNARTDLRDKASAAANAPIEKLTRNIGAGRFGQGAPAAAWLALVSTGGPLAEMFAAEGKPPNIFQSGKKKRAVRDKAFSVLFDAVATGINSALTQALFTARDRVEAEWENDVVQTNTFIATARTGQSPTQIAAQVLQRWKSALRSLGSNCQQNKWLSALGNAALLGSAAGGVPGAAKLAVALGQENDVRQARKVLQASITQAIETLVGEYQRVLDEVAGKIADPLAVQLHAAEFLDRT